jgi:cation diffusion facilitator family transporter
LLYNINVKPNKISTSRVITTSFLVDISDILLNLFIAVISGSVIMLTQTLEGASDLISSGLLLYGFRKSTKVKDKKHPFGYGKELYFYTMMAAFTSLTISSVVSFILGYHRFTNPHPIQNINTALIVLLFSFTTNAYSFSLSFKRILGEHNIKHIIQVFYRSNLVETKTTLILDLMGSLASLLGIISLEIYLVTNNSRFDGLGAMLISILLAILALSIVIEVKDLLIGKSASPKIENKIIQVAKSIPAVNDVLDLRTMIIGNNKILVNLEVNLKNELTTDELELLIDKIKAKIRSEIPSVSPLQIELESPDQP